MSIGHKVNGKNEKKNGKINGKINGKKHVTCTCIINKALQDASNLKLMQDFRMAEKNLQLF